MSDETPEMQRIERALMNTVKKAANTLNLDSVVIIATFRSDEEGQSATRSIKVGAGNAYAQYGSVVDWLNRQDQI